MCKLLILLTVLSQAGWPVLKEPAPTWPVLKAAAGQPQSAEPGALIPDATPRPAPPDAPPSLLYADAHQRAVEEGLPLVVYITGAWCPACQSVKPRVLSVGPRLGSFAVVDWDAQTEVARPLCAGLPLPVLCVYRQRAGRLLLERRLSGADRIRQYLEMHP